MKSRGGHIRCVSFVDCISLWFKGMDLYLGFLPLVILEVMY